MAENSVPANGVLIFAKRSSDATYQMVSISDTGAMNVAGSITASLGAFTPKGKATLAVGVASARVALPTADTSLVLRNTGANDAWFKLGSGSVAAATPTDFLLKSGDEIGIDATGSTNIAGITASGSTTFEIWTGTGLPALSQAGASGGGGGNVNLNQVGGVAVALGQTTKSASIPMTLASDTGSLPVTPLDRVEVLGSSSAAAVLTNFPVADTGGARSAAVQITTIAAGSTLVVEESNDGATWTNLVSAGGMAAQTATGLYGYNFTAKQLRVRQSVYGGAGSSGVTVELRAAPLPHDYAIGALLDAKATDSTSSWSVIAVLKGLYALLAGTLATKEIRSGTCTRTSVAGSASSGTILASNASRLGAAIYNDSTAILYLDESGGTATTANYTVQLAANDYYEVPAGFTGLITGIWASATGAAKVKEFT